MLRIDDVTLPMFLSTFSLQGGKLRKKLDRKINFNHTCVTKCAQKQNESGKEYDVDCR